MNTEHRYHVRNIAPAQITMIFHSNSCINIASLSSIHPEPVSCRNFETPLPAPADNIAGFTLNQHFSPKTLVRRSIFLAHLHVHNVLLRSRLFIPGKDLKEI